ncbi:uncharacterized protein C22orf15 homolog isoform X9 [Papio anubis]|uniref:uncharacterized protein C22orf15 homolog isoform X9 n=1 Tax=Papio anubis TaxID=9555 RepID=UPI0004F1F4AA|nr:uncharacterized protein C22orf15 homolog isoform X9 [Papio anubis]XP_009196944.1 uncharacterized protein C22orf15 homolog isoform X9 [Papio anubis]
MFIKVMFGAGCSVLVNTSCRLVNLTAHLRQKAGLPPDASLHVLSATIALLAEDGNLVSLEEDLKEGAAWTQTMGNSLLKERAIYVLVRTIKGEDMVPTRYESLLENLDDHYPELAGLPGPSRGTAQAVRPLLCGPQLEEAHGHPAWPP